MVSKKVCAELAPVWVRQVRVGAQTFWGRRWQKSFPEVFNLEAVCPLREKVHEKFTIALLKF